MKVFTLIVRFISLLILFSNSTSASAYTEIKIFKDLFSGKFYPFQKWNTRDLYQGELKVITDTVGSDFYPNLKPAVNAAVKTLNRVQRTRLRFTHVGDWDAYYKKHPDYNDLTAEEMGYGDVLVYFSPSVWGTGLLAATGFMCYKEISYKHCPHRAGIIFNSEDKWNVGLGRPSNDQYDLQSVAVHELLHFTGQNHVLQKYCSKLLTAPTMCPLFGLGESWPRTLERSDVNGMQNMYP